MATINGTAVNFGYTGTNGIVMTGITGSLLQSAEESAEAEREVTRDGIGDIVTSGWYDQHRKADLEWVVTGTGLAAAITNTTLTGLTPGAILVISACASHPSLIATTWEVVSGARIVGSNTTSKRIRVSLEKRAGITAAASA